MQHYSPNALSLLTVSLMKAAVTRQAISSKDFLQVGFPCILHSLILKQTAFQDPLYFLEAQKSKKCPLKTAIYHIAKDYEPHSPSFHRHFIDKIIKSGSDTQTGDLQEQTRCLEHNLEYIQAITQLQGLCSSIPCLQSVFSSLL